MVCICLIVDTRNQSQIFAWFQVKGFTQSEPPVEPGHLVLAQLMSAMSIEGYSAQAGHEKSYIHDTSLTSHEWITLPRPGIVTDIEWDEQVHMYYFTIVAISKRRATAELSDLAKVHILGPNSANEDSSAPTISIEPQWPLDHSYCYAFKDPATFYCLPSQVRSNCVVRGSLINDLHCRRQFLSSGEPMPMMQLTLTTSSIQSTILWRFITNLNHPTQTSVMI